jgi:hypothetical protein
LVRVCVGSYPNRPGRFCSLTSSRPDGLTLSCPPPPDEEEGQVQGPGGPEAIADPCIPFLDIFEANFKGLRSAIPQAFGLGLLAKFSPVCLFPQALRSAQIDLFFQDFQGGRGGGLPLCSGDDNITGKNRIGFVGRKGRIELLARFYSIGSHLL